MAELSNTNHRQRRDTDKAPLSRDMRCERNCQAEVIINTTSPINLFFSQTLLLRKFFFKLFFSNLIGRNCRDLYLNNYKGEVTDLPQIILLEHL